MPIGTLVTELTHVVYTRNASGIAKIYINGTEQMSSTVGGDFSTWSSYALALANELSGGRPWLGELYLVAFYDRALTSDEVDQNFSAGPNPGSPIANDPSAPNVSIVPFAAIF